MSSNNKFSSFGIGMTIALTLAPMLDSFKKQHYEQASTLLFGLAKFLYGYGEGIEDFPSPPKLTTEQNTSSRERQGLIPQYIQKQKDYFTDHYPTVMQRIGQYESSVIDVLRKRNDFGGY